MTNATRIWICPALCGCELRIAASWVDAQPDEDGTGRAVTPLGGGLAPQAITAANWMLVIVPYKLN